MEVFKPFKGYTHQGNTHTLAIVIVYLVNISTAHKNDVTSQRLSLTVRFKNSDL